MVRAAALGLMLAVALPASAQETEAPGRKLAWLEFGANKAVFYVFEDETTRAPSGHVTVWVHGDHTTDKSVSYRKSLTREQFDCRGSYTTIAATHYKADGSVLRSWDGYGRAAYIRPNAIYDSLEKAICPK